MIPGLIYTTGREGESSARIINGMEKISGEKTATLKKTKR